jgi:hypothetical protein
LSPTWPSQRLVAYAPHPGRKAKGYRRGERFDCEGLPVLAWRIVFPLSGIRASFVQNLGIGVAFTPVVAGTQLCSAALVRWAFPATDVARYSRPWQVVNRRLINACPVRDGARQRSGSARCAADNPNGASHRSASGFDTPAGKRSEAAGGGARDRTAASDLVTANAARSAPEPENPKSKRKVIEPIGRDASDKPGLTSGKVNAIRAAVKAGVKPMAIARQLGVSMSAIKSALEDKR